MKIRPFGPGDLDELIEFVRLAHGQTAYAKFPFSESVTRRSLNRLINNRRESFATGAWKDGELVGALLAIANPMWFSPKKQAVDLCFFTHPEKGVGAGVGLMRRYLRWAENHSAIVQVGLSYTAGGGKQERERVERLYEAFGAEYMGGQYEIRLGAEHVIDHQECG